MSSNQSGGAELQPSAPIEEEKEIHLNERIIILPELLSRPVH